MTLVLTNEGEQIILEAMVNKTAPQDLVLFLWTDSDVEPAKSTTMDNLTEAAGEEYEAKTLAGASWTYTEEHPSVISYAEQTFDTSDSDPVYGYGVRQSSSGKLVWLEAFDDGPYDVDEVKVTPPFTLQ